METKKIKKHNEKEFSMSDKKKNEVGALMEQLENGIRDMYESDRYKIYLSTMSKFHSYSLNNIMLIAMQQPKATMVAGYKAWETKFERHVNAGEHGIKIFAPAPYKKKIQEMVEDEDGNIVKTEKEITIPSFKVTRVFDITQTSGKPLPSLVNELEGSLANRDKIQNALNDISPVPIRFDSINDSSYGYYSRDDNEIVIKEGLSDIQTIKTMIHEITHSMLHNKDDELSRNAKEVQAESVAYVVCQHFGIDTSDYSFGYVGGWSKTKELDELKESLNEIKKTSLNIIEGIENKILKKEPIMVRKRKVI